METVTARYPVIAYYDEREILVATDNDRAVLAMIDPWATGNRRFDGCGSAIIEIDDFGYMEFTTCHESCMDYYRDDLARIDAALSGVQNDWKGSADTWSEAMFKTAKRAGISLAVLSDSDYGVTACEVNEPEDLEDGPIVMASTKLTTHPDAAYQNALLHAAEINNQTWIVGSMDLEEYRNRVAEDEELSPLDCDDTVHGYIWKNVDSDGDSTPTEAELLGAL